MVYLNSLKQSSYINKKKYDNYDTYTNISDIQTDEQVKDRLYYITSENKHYRYDTNTSSFVEILGGSDVDLTPLETAIALKQDALTVDSNHFTLTDGILKLANGIYLRATIGGFPTVSILNNGTIQSKSMFTENLECDNGIIINAPVNETDITNKEYVDTLLETKQDKLTVYSDHLTLLNNELKLKNNIILRNGSNTATIQFLAGSGIIQANNMINFNETITDDYHVVNKKYVDTRLSAINSNPQVDNENIIITYDDKIALNTHLNVQGILVYTLDEGNHTIDISASEGMITCSNLTPTENGHLTTKAYVDANIKTYTAGTNITISGTNVISHNNTANNERFVLLENIFGFNATNNYFNGINMTYSFPFVAWSGSNKVTQSSPLCNVFWNIKDLIFVSVSISLSIGENENFNNSNLLTINLPFKKYTMNDSPTSSNGFGTIRNQYQANHHSVYGGIWGHKQVTHSIVSNFENGNGDTQNTYFLAAPYDYINGTHSNILCSDIYNKTLYFQTQFYYKARWPLERVV